MEVVNTVGRRKAAVARVYVKPGKGTITVNHKPMETYFPLDIFQYVVKQPLLVLENPESYDITINLTGGGIHGQAEAAHEKYGNDTAGEALFHHPKARGRAGAVRAEAGP